MTPVLASLLMMAAAAGRHAPKSGAGDMTPTIVLLAGAVSVVIISVLVAMGNARAGIKIYTSLTVIKRTAGQAYLTALILYAVLLVVIGMAFNTPFYKIQPINVLFNMAAGVLRAPAPQGGLPDMKGLYTIFHAIVAGVVSAFVVMFATGSIAGSLAGKLRKPPPAVQ